MGSSSREAKNSVCVGCKDREGCKIPCQLLEPEIDYKEIYAQKQEDDNDNLLYNLNCIKDLPMDNKEDLQKKAVCACLLVGIPFSKMKEAGNLIMLGITRLKELKKGWIKKK